MCTREGVYFLKDSLRCRLQVSYSRTVKTSTTRTMGPTRSAPSSPRSRTSTSSDAFAADARPSPSSAPSSQEVRQNIHRARLRRQPTPDTNGCWPSTANTGRSRPCTTFSTTPSTRTAPASEPDTDPKDHPPATLRSRRDPFLHRPVRGRRSTPTARNPRLVFGYCAWRNSPTDTRQPSHQVLGNL